MPRLFLLSALAAAVLAGEPSPLAALPADAALVLQAPDIPASAERWSRTPYPRLLDSSWGRILLGEWRGRLAAALPDGPALLGRLRRVAAAGADAPWRPLAISVGLDGDAAPLLAALQPQLPYGELAAFGPVLSWWAEGTPRLGRAAPPAPAADAVLEARIADTSVRVQWQLDPLGLRESWQAAANAASQQAARRLRAVDASELQRLPATTLWAMAWRLEPELVAALPGHAQWRPALDALLARQHLPTLAETLAASQGQGLLWLNEGTPFPALTLAWPLAPELAERWLAALQERWRLRRQGATVSGFIGLLPLSAGVANDGRFVVTTDPQGLQAWQGLRPGFTAQPEVAAAIERLPKRAVLVAIDRGGRFWATLAQLAVPLFVALGAPQAVALPLDLRATTDRGWFWLRLAEDGAWSAEGVGLSGGPLATAAALAVGIHATQWLERALRQEGRLPDEASSAAHPSSF
ncbi:MAG: hypothetical protein RMM29_03155 [Planctomycetota bacterium]|nr:hypothetical protein [Planctomycetota bacterium]MCX8039260.1 hypothetical protein [Planctomycetota bacterium]MDW8372630.1 hypothetical protein [Planctomycetota bacterium]